MADLLESALASVAGAGVPLVAGTFIDFEAIAKVEIDGTIDAFTVAVKTLGAKVVYVETHVVSEEEFMVDLEDDEDDDGGEQIDLREAFPSLAAHNARIGQRRALDFICMSPPIVVTKLVRADWDDDFIDAIANARESWYEAAAEGA